MIKPELKSGLEGRIALLEKDFADAAKKLTPFYQAFPSSQNAILLSLAHIFFRSTLVMFLTFIGGILFAFTFNKTKSTLLVSIEHAIYGCWLFTVGMGDMLGFPA